MSLIDSTALQIADELEEEVGMEAYVGRPPPMKPPARKKLKKWHREAIKMHLDGVPGKTIAEVLGRRQVTLSILWNDPLVRPILDQAQALADAELDAMYPKAVDVMRGTLNSEDETIRIRALGVFFKERRERKAERPNSGPVTAEDLIRQMYARQQPVNIQVNVGKQDGE